MLSNYTVLHLYGIICKLDIFSLKMAIKNKNSKPLAAWGSLSTES